MFASNEVRSVIDSALSESAQQTLMPECYWLAPVIGVPSSKYLPMLYGHNKGILSGTNS